MTSRTAKLGVLHALKRDRGLDDDTYRDMLFLATGHRSAKDLSDAQLDTAINVFRPNRAPTGKASSPYAAKLKALYLSAFNLGAFDDGSDAAIATFVERQTGKKALQFLTPGDANKVSEGLKAICSRHGFDVPAGDAGGMESRKALLKAQWKRLGELGVLRVPAEEALDQYVSIHFLGHRGSLIHMSATQLDQAAKALGRWIRSVQAGQKKSGT